MTEKQNCTPCVCIAGSIVLICLVLAKIASVPVFELIGMNVSAYCKNSCCCGRFADGFTASGVPAEGLIVAAPPEYPFGTVMDVPGYGRAVVQDRGGKITGNKLDILFADHQSALNFGRKQLKVKVFDRRNK